MTFPLPEEDLEDVKRELEAALNDFHVSEKEIGKEEDELEAELIEAAEKKKKEELAKKLYA